MNWQWLRAWVFSSVVALVVGVGAVAAFTGWSVIDASPAVAQTQGSVPGGVRGGLSQSEMWRAVRGGIAGTVSIPDKQAGQLVQSDGDNWRAFKNGPLSQFGGWLLLATIVIIALFFALRGRIKIDHGPHPEGATIERFNSLERAVHWLTATSFIVLALTGLNMLYGRYILPDLIGKSAFASMTYYLKLGHHYIAFAFMFGLIIMFVMWVGHNIPKARDVQWFLIAGGLFSKNVHPEAGRFNGGQKLIFWLVMGGGLTLSISGLAMLMPGTIEPWAWTFKMINILGFDLPTELSSLQEMQVSVLWHGFTGLVMMAIIIGHIYIGSLGMEGAFDAVGSGQVDLNWAKEHHSIWVEEVQGADTSKQAPAE